MGVVKMDESPDSRKGYVRKAGTELEPLPRALTKEETENLVEYVRKAWGYVWRNDQWELEVASPDSTWYIRLLQW
jgi:hypothetical protein